jgi:Tol biopolymer transport system component
LFEQSGAIWTVHPDGANLFKVADTPIEYYWRSYKAQPVWSPDGRRIAFAAPGVGEEKNADIFVVNADGSGLINLTEDSDEDFQPAWSPDGQHIAFVASGGIIYAIDVSGKEITTIFSSSTIGAAGPTWSPDGSQIAFVVNPGDIWAQQLYITDWAGDSPRQLGEDYVGERPVWVLIPGR